MALITSSYASQQKFLHETDKDYGSRGFNWGYLVVGIAVVEKCSTVLDYGCGKGSLCEIVKRAGIDISGYDPGVNGRESLPVKADLVTVIDVLEHIEPECISDVLDHLFFLSEKLLLVAIAIRLSSKTLPDGRNAHVSIGGPDWWRSQLEDRGFKVRRVWNTGQKEWVAMLQRMKQ